MPMCTYLSDGEHTRPVNDKELNNLLRWVKDATKEDWRIGEHEFTVRRWFRKPKSIKQYTLYKQTVSVEFQIINFYRPDRGDNSINSMNDAGHVAAFLYGVLAGVEAQSALAATATATGKGE